MNKIIIKLSSLQAPERELIGHLYPEFVPNVGNDVTTTQPRDGSGMY
jgi:hypothetical protein